MTPAQQELRELIRSKLTDGMTADESASAVASLFYRVEDDWDTVDISTMQDGRGGRLLDQRSLVAWVPREARERSMVPDRTTPGPR